MIKIRTKILFSLIVVLILGTFSPDAFGFQENYTAKIDSTVSDSTFVAEQSGMAVTQFGEAGKIDMLSLVGKMIGYLSVIVIMIFGLVYFLKKFIYTRKEGVGKNGAIRVLSSTYIAPKKSLMMIEVLDRLLVVSITEENMNLLTELDKEEYSAYMEEGGGKTINNQANGQFGDIFNRFLKRAKQ